MPGIPDVALGADEFLYVSTESAYGVWARPVAADGVRVREITFGRDQERVTRDDKIATRSHTERIKRKKTSEWTIRAYIVPSGVDPSVTATPPDVGDLLKALFGLETVNTGVDVQYTLVRDQSLSLTLHRICDHFSESLTGCVPNTASFKWSGTDEPEIEITGFGKDWVITTSHVTGEDATISGTAVKVARADDVCDVNSVIAFKVGSTTYDNTGIGYHISAVTAGDWSDITIATGVNDAIDFDEGALELNATIFATIYTTGAALAAAVKAALETAGADTYTVTFDKDTAKFTIASDGTSFSILWLTGTNTATNASAELGFDNTADDTGALSYGSDEAVTTGEITTDESGGWEFGFPEGSDIIPFFPAPTTSGSPENSIDGTVAVGDLDFNTTEGSVEYNGNMESRNDFYGYESSQGFSVAGRREVTFSSTSYLQARYARELKKFIRFDELHEVVVTFGSVAGSIFEIHLPNLEFDNNPFVVPEEEEATINFTGMALDPSTPFEGEIYLVFK